MSGITSIFPKNRLFSGYYRGNLPENAINKVDALAGAFLLVRKEVLEKTGGFDERFFMYAEDIDLCYRIFKAGYANYYYPPVTIIHFKGESTQKNATYIKHFYNAMILFVRKHATNSLQRFYAGLLEMAIHFRSLLAKLVISDPVAEVPSIPLNIRVDGDVDSKNEVVGILASNVENSNEILFCEGKSMRFSTIFAKIQEKDHRQRIYFHAGGTRSVIGSPSSKNRGVFIPLDNK